MAAFGVGGMSVAEVVGQWQRQRCSCGAVSPMRFLGAAAVSATVLYSRAVVWLQMHQQHHPERRSPGDLGLAASVSVAVALEVAV